MKFTKKDIKVVGRNTQVRSKILEKFGSIEEFAKAVNMTPSSIEQYITVKKEYYEPFKEKLSEHFGDYNSLIKSEKQQIEEFVDTLKWNIHLYTEKSDVEVIEAVLNLAIEYDLASCIAMTYWCMGMYYINMGEYDVSLRFFILGRRAARKVEDCDSETLIIAKILIAYTSMGQYREANKLYREFESSKRVEKANHLSKFWYYHSVANLFIHEKDYYCAKMILEKSKDYTENNYRAFNCLNLLGVCNKREGDYNTALILYKQALSLAESANDKAICYNNIAAVYHLMRYKERAIENINQAMALIEPYDVGKHIDIFETYVDIMDDKEGLNTLLSTLEGQPQTIFMPYAIGLLQKLVNKNVETERLEKIIVQYIKFNKDDATASKVLYNILGVLRFMEVNNK